MVSSAAAAAVSEEDFSAAAASSTQESAALGTVSTAPATAAAATPPQAWAWENHDGLFVTGRRIWMDHPESPETARASEVSGDLNLSSSCWTEDRK